MISFLEPEKIISQLELKPDYHVAEFGCGPGGFVIPLARKLFKGMVYALDIQEEALSALTGRARAEGLNNIRKIRCDLEEPKGSRIQDNLMDLVVVSNILFQSEHKEAMLKEAKRILKPKGQMLIVDWKKDSPFGPVEGRVELEDIKAILIRLELKQKKELEAGTYHWGVVLEK